MTIPKTLRQKTLLILWLSAFVVLRARALDPRTSLSQAQHTSWSSSDGAPSRVVDLAQTNDGFLWLASQMGLFRFDGVTFQNAPLAAHQQSEPDTTAVFATGDNELWVGTRRDGVYHLRNGAVLAHFGPENGLPRATVYSLRKDSFGTLWAAGAAGVFHLRGDRFIRVWPTTAATALPAANLYRDRAGTLCFTTDVAVWCKPSTETAFHVAFLGAVEDLALDAAGLFHVWVSGEGVKPLESPGSDSAKIAIAVLHGHCVFSRSGELYLLTYGKGLIRYTGQSAQPGEDLQYRQESFSAAQGLQSPYLSSLLEDREGNIWVGTTRGLERFRNGKFVPMPLFAGMPGAVLLAAHNGAMWVGRRVDPLLLASVGNEVLPSLPAAPSGITAAFRDRDGSAWFGASPVLWQVRNGHATSLRLPTYVQGSSDVQAIARDADGTLWVSVVRFGTLLYRNGEWSRVSEGPQTDTENFAAVFLLDSQSRFWTAFRGGVELRTAAGRRTLLAADGLDFGDVSSLVDDDGLLLAGAEGGLGVFLHDRFQRVQSDAGTLLRGISGMAVSQDGALWLHCRTALLRIAPEDLPALRNGGTQPLHTQVFSFADGLPGLAPGVRPLPSLGMGDDGRLWVSTASGVAWIDTLHYPRNGVAPAVRIGSVQADRKTYSEDSAVQIPPRSRTIRFSWTAPSLSLRDGVHFRTRLLGYDTEWQDVGTTHTVSYASLPAGRYRFEVLAGNEDDVWSAPAQGVPVEVLPAFYQSLWFRLAAGVAALIVLWALYRIRLRAVMARIRDLMAERLAERERIAAELHDTLLQSVQGLILLFSGVAAQLPSDSRFAASTEAAIQRAEVLLEEGRDSVRDLRKKTIDLSECFRALHEEFAGSSTGYHFQSRGQQPALQMTVGEEVYKVGREAVRNAAKHAHAKQVFVSLAFFPHALKLVVRDNGAGMSKDVVLRGRSGHWGLQGMTERARKLRGVFVVQSTPGEGTAVRLTVPASMAYSDSSPTLSALLRSYAQRLRGFVSSRELD